ncbi:Carbon-nitrogen hydrolase, partial [Podila epicladia]
YVFTSKEHIEPYLEDAETGPSVQWAKTQGRAPSFPSSHPLPFGEDDEGKALQLPIFEANEGEQETTHAYFPTLNFEHFYFRTWVAVAKRLNAHVVVGFPEKKKKTAVEGDDQEPDLVYYNSIAFVDPQGQLVTTYAKTFLYYTDENWAEEGPGFKSIEVEGLGKVGFGICMDVNPYQFKAPFAAFEFSSYHVEHKSTLLLCSMAWNKGEEAPKKEKTTPKPKKSTSENIQEQEDDDDEEDWEDDEETEEERAERESQTLTFETIQYWAMRMNPFYTQAKEASETYIAIANRIGTEGGNLFVGSSCVMKLSKKGPELLGALPANEEGLLRVEIPN